MIGPEDEAGVRLPSGVGVAQPELGDKPDDQEHGGRNREQEPADEGENRCPGKRTT